MGKFTGVGGKFQGSGWEISWEWVGKFTKVDGRFHRSERESYQEWVKVHMIRMESAEDSNGVQGV